MMGSILHLLNYKAAARVKPRGVFDCFNSTLDQLEEGLR